MKTAYDSNRGEGVTTTRASISRRKRATIVLGGGLLATCLMVAGSVGQEVAPGNGSATATTQPAAQRVTGGALVGEGLSPDGRLRLNVNKSTVITTKVPYKRVNVGQPEVADVNPIGPSNILVTAKKTGSTQLIIWDDADRSQVIDVIVEVDVQALADQFRTMFPESKIEVSSVNGAIALRGRVPTLEAAEQAEALAKPYSEKVLNFLEVSGGQQVMLQVRFAEVSRSASNALGVNFGATDGISIFGNNTGQLSPLGFHTSGPDDVIDNLGTPQPSSATNIFGIGSIDGNPFSYFIQAMRDNNLMRILAEPNLIAMSGQQASFLAGGEFPIPVTQDGGSGGSGSITVEYREFGVRLNFTPIVMGDGRIHLKVEPEVSDLDFTTAVRFGGFVVPGLTSRKVSTTIELSEGQSFAIAGLLNNTVTTNQQVTPLLGDLPIVGALFRSVRYQRKETELVVLVTPRIVAPMNPNQIPQLPGERWRHPTEAELYLFKDMGGPDAGPIEAQQEVTEQDLARYQAPRYRGRHGFTADVAQTAASTAE